MLFAVLASVLAALSSCRASPTDDEPTYVGQGAYLLASGDFRAPALLWQPPLALYVTSAALPLADLPDGAFDARPPADSLTALGDRLIFASPSPPERVLLASRLPVIVVTGLLAALAAFLGGRLGGPLGALIAGALVAASPAVYAHGGLATTDVVATAAALLAVAPLALAAATPSPWTARRAVLVGAALGVALLAKHTAVTLVPVTLIATYVLVRRDGAAWNTPWNEHVNPGPPSPWNEVVNRRGRAAAFAATAGAAALVVLWAGYGFHTGPLVTEDSAGDLAARLGPSGSAAEWLARNVPVPCPRYWQSLVFQASKQHGRLYFQYFGEVSKTGWWTYFPVVALGKATLGSVVLLGLAAWTLRRRRPGAAEWVLLAAFAVPFAAAVVSRHNLGVRHVLPALVPLLVLVGVRLARDGAGTMPRLAAAGAMLVLHLAEGVGAAPDGVAWWNLAAGGTRGGWRIATGANADWGQGLWRLRDEARAGGLGEVHVIAHGPRSALDAADGEALRVLPESARRGPFPDSGWLAVSTSLSRRGPDDPVTNAPPDLFLAGCYRVYRLPLRGPATR